MLDLTIAQVLYLRTLGQKLDSRSSASSVIRIARDLCGLQAQELPAAALQIWARSSGLIAEDVEKARVQERSVIRTWGQRYTLHLLATEDLEWLLPLFGPVFIGGSRSRRVELGLDDETSARGSLLIRQVLAGQGPLTRAEIVQQLAAKGLPLAGQAVPHLLGYTSLEGWICQGPEREGEPTYVLLEDWVKGWKLRPLEKEATYRELALRYLAAYAPAGPEDFSRWSGLPLKEIKVAWKSLENQFLEGEVEGRRIWLLKSQQGWLEEPVPEAPEVRLLPRYDTYLLGYQNREWFVPPSFSGNVNAGGGIIHPTLIVNGKVAGTWKSTRSKKKLEITVQPFEKLSLEIQPGLEAEARDIGRFEGTEALLRVLTPLS